MPTECEHATLDAEPYDRQHSAGGLVVRGDRVLLIATQGGRRWQLPKGHLEAGETPREAAEREVLEETGVHGRSAESLGSIEFDFRSRSGQRILKQVDYFVFDFVDGSVEGYDPSEVTEARWFSWEEALRRLTFDNERNLVRRAQLLRSR